MQKWLVDVRCEGCKGLFYRSAPNEIVPDADWPRNGDIVVGHEIPNVPGKFFALPPMLDAMRLSFPNRIFLRYLQDGFASRMDTIYQCRVMMAKSLFSAKFPLARSPRTLR
jgi:hypothetical protein